MKRLAITAALCAASGMLVTGSGLAGSPGDTDGGSAATGTDTASAIVRLNGSPLSTDAKTKPPKGKKIDFNSGMVKSYRAQLNNLRNDFKRWLRDNAPEQGDRRVRHLPERRGSPVERHAARDAWHSADGRRRPVPVGLRTTGP